MPGVVLDGGDVRVGGKGEQRPRVILHVEHIRLSIHIGKGEQRPRVILHVEHIRLSIYI